MTSLETRPSIDHHVTEWQAVIKAAVASAVRPGTPVALVNFPNHGNAGDVAIWLGTLRVLSELGCPVAYACNPSSYSADALRRAVPEGPILINGGGNFGDLHPPQQLLRERLLAEQVSIPIVQLPQSIHFENDDNLQRTQRLIAAHGQVTIMAREDRSLALARSFDADVVACPDLCLCLGPLRPPGHPDSDVLWLRRQTESPEYVDPGPPPDRPSWQAVEWLESLAVDQERWPEADRALLARNVDVWQRCLDSEESRRHEWPDLAATFAPLAEAWVRRGLAMLSRGRVVVTERLHGHLLCLLLGIPHVVLDNSYGKCSATMQTWTGTHPLAHLAPDAAAAADIATELLAEGAHTS